MMMGGYGYEDASYGFDNYGYGTAYGSSFIQHREVAGDGRGDDRDGE